MKKITGMAAIVALAFAFGQAAVVAAEGEAGVNAVPQDVGRVMQPGSSAGKADRAALSDELKAAIQDFQQARADFLKAQADLRKGLRTATSEERARIREQLKTLCSGWLQDQQQYRDRIREELRELRETLRNARDKQLDEVKGKGKGGKGRD
jgi:ABC-type transporter MlaC component